jgi:hypothetical protein
MLAATLLSGCGFGPSHSATRDRPTAPLDTGTIPWPEDLSPRTATFFVHNTIDIDAPVSVVWEELIRAEEWSSWYRGAQEVRVVGGDGGRLGPQAIIHWRTMGLDFSSRIEAFEPTRLLAWRSEKTLISGYHAWLITATDTGCRVTTDEAQRGFLAVMQGWFLRDQLYLLHDDWLRHLKHRAEALAKNGLPGSMP